MYKYESGRGFQIEGDWQTHASKCVDCQRVRSDKPASIAFLCLAGAVLFKEYMAQIAPPPKKERAERPENWRSKSEVKAATRYK